MKTTYKISFIPFVHNAAAKQHIMLYNEHKINFIENVAGAEIVIQILKDKDDIQAAKISPE